MESSTSQKEQLKSRLEDLLMQGAQFIATCPESEISKKVSEEKWSKKEILGHLIDSGINNLQRFTEIQFETKPYIIKKYKQNELVKANAYQQADTQQLLSFCLAINHWILNLVDQQTQETLAYEIKLGNGEIADLNYLMEDYVAHLAHHLNQIMNK